jgi:rod shape-determining protein MreC
VLINNLTPDSRIQPGEQVITSGGDGVFPRGLPVGSIEKIELDPKHQPFTTIMLHPAVNLSQLDEVLVVTSLSTPETESAQDLAADPAMHAADVSAEKLPSLHDDKTPAPADPENKDATPPPDKSTDLVPKPKPALHPDRYSPGAAPPAADLTPGAPRQ